MCIEPLPIFFKQMLNNPQFVSQTLFLHNLPHHLAPQTKNIKSKGTFFTARRCCRLPLGTSILLPARQLHLHRLPNSFCTSDPNSPSKWQPTGLCNQQTQWKRTRGRQITKKLYRNNEVGNYRRRKTKEKGRKGRWEGERMIMKGKARETIERRRGEVEAGRTVGGK